MKSKFKNNINELLENNIITQEVAQNIDAFYLSKQSKTPNKLFTIFAVLGAALIGLGIILILAHNWDHFTVPIKTVLAFLPLTIAQLFVGYSILKEKNNTWREATGVFLFFTVGSSMALVAQIYNIPGNLSSYLLTWIVLCLPLIYLLRSNVLCMLSVVFLTYYGCAYGYFNNPVRGTPWFYVLLLVTIFPYYGKLIKKGLNLNVISILNWLIPLSVIIVLGAFVNHNGSLGYIMYVCLFGVLYNLGRLSYFENQSLRRNGYLVLGSVGTIYMLLLSSFEWIWDDLFKDELITNSQEVYIYLVLFVIASVVLIYQYKKTGVQKLNLFQFVFLIFSIIFFIGLNDVYIPLVLINILVLTLGIIAIKIGVEKLHFGVLNYGLLIIVILIVCRFFDTNMSFIIRGLLFVTVGVGFFLTNYFMLLKRKSIDNQQK